MQNDNEKLRGNLVALRNSKCKIIFWGTSDFAVPALKALIGENYDIVGVITQPEKPVGRQRIIISSPIKKIALESRIQVFEPSTLKDDKFFEKFKHLNPDLCIVAAYGKIIPKKYLDVPKYGFLNIHPSLLPKYRGPSPIQAAIMKGEKEAGITILKIDEEMDHGPLLASRKFSIFNFRFSNQKELEKELSELGGKLLLEILPKYIAGEIEPKEQDHSGATFTKLLTREDGRIDWSQPAEKIYNQIRALNPEPGTWTIWDNKILNIKSSITTCDVVITGTTSQVVLSGSVSFLNEEVAVKTGKCYLILKQIQLEGGKEMDAKSFINGHPDFLNSRLG